MKENIKIAIFDFCGTFINFQTADEYASTFLDNKKIDEINKRMEFYNKTRISLICSLFNHPLKKHFLARALKGIKKDVINSKTNEFITDRLLTNINPLVSNLFNKLRAGGYFIILVSAAYDIYLSKFNNYYHFDKIISTELEIKNGCFTGRIKHDCVGKKKVKYLKKYLNKKIGKDNYDIIYSIGDSKSDTQILDLATYPLVVAKEKQKWFKRSYQTIYEFQR